MKVSFDLSLIYNLIINVSNGSINYENYRMFLMYEIKYSINYKHFARDGRINKIMIDLAVNWVIYVSYRQ